MQQIRPHLGLGFEEAIEEADLCPYCGRSVKPTDAKCRWCRARIELPISLWDVTDARGVVFLASILLAALASLLAIQIASGASIDLGQRFAGTLACVLLAGVLIRAAAIARG